MAFFSPVIYSENGRPDKFITGKGISTEFADIDSNVYTTYIKSYVTSQPYERRMFIYNDILYLAGTISSNILTWVSYDLILKKATIHTLNVASLNVYNDCIYILTEISPLKFLVCSNNSNGSARYTKAHIIDYANNRMTTLTNSASQYTCSTYPKSNIWYGIYDHVNTGVTVEKLVWNGTNLTTSYLLRQGTMYKNALIPVASAVSNNVYFITYTYNSDILTLNVYSSKLELLFTTNSLNGIKISSRTNDDIMVHIVYRYGNIQFFDIGHGYVYISAPHNTKAADDLKSISIICKLSVDISTKTINASDIHLINPMSAYQTVSKNLRLFQIFDKASFVWNQNDDDDLSFYVFNNTSCTYAYEPAQIMKVTFEEES